MALSQAQQQLADGDSRATAAAAGFICIGDGMSAQATPSNAQLRQPYADDRAR